MQELRIKEELYHEIRYISFGAHPDDVELGCGGTIIKEVLNGKVGVIDLTRGELEPEEVLKYVMPNQKASNNGYFFTR